MVFANPRINNTIQVFSYANSVTDGFFMTIMLIVVWIILFVSFKFQWRADTSFVSASFLTMLISMILAVADLVSDFVVVVFVLMFLAGAFITAKSSGDEAI